MKISFNWQAAMKKIDPITGKEVPHQTDRDYIWMDIGIKGLSEEDAYEFQNILEKQINNNVAPIYGNAEFSRCTGYGDAEDGVLEDYLGWKRNFGCVAEQKTEIKQLVRNAFEEAKEIFLEKQGEREER